MKFKILSWSRGEGHHNNPPRPMRDICNSITTFAGGGVCCNGSEMANTTPYVFIIDEIPIPMATR